jgi:uncharacterized protein YjiS (DUF1127 family)
MTAFFFSGVTEQAWRSAGAFAAAVDGCFARLIKEWHYRSDMHTLQDMSDRELRDMGLSRDRIEDAVRGRGQVRAKLRTTMFDGRNGSLQAHRKRGVD